MAWRSCCKAPSLLVDEQPHEQPLEAQQFIKGAPGKGVVSHEWTCRWCTWRVVAIGINKLRNHLLGTNTCTASSQAFLAVRDELLRVQQQQLAAAATAANVRASFYANGIAFYASRSLEFREMVAAIARQGAAYTAPKYDALRTTLLDTTRQVNNNI